MSWLLDNKEWLFSGAGLSVIGILYKIYTDRKTNTEIKPNTNTNTNTINISVDSLSDNNNSSHKNTEPKSLEQHKNDTRILFIDDDTKFKVTKILIRSGWVHTKLIKDCEGLDDHDIIDAHILFIDVQGVGIALGFTDEGLGLALAIKKKYPHKKVVIYSAETHGDRFHEALRQADSFLPKNADPYEFQRLIEEFTFGQI